MSLTQDPVEPHLRRRRARRLLPPKEREIGIQEYENGSSGTNIVLLYVKNRCMCGLLFYMRIHVSRIWTVHSVRKTHKAML